MSKSSTAPKQDADAHAAEFQFLVFEGKTGKNAEFEQLGEHVLFSLSGEPLVLTPGLQRITAAEWAKWEKIPAVVELIESEALRVVDEQLADYRGRGRMQELAMATVSPEGVEHMQALELAKPSSGRPGERRDPHLLALLENRLALAQQRRTLNVSGIMDQAKTTALIHEARKR